MHWALLNTLHAPETLYEIALKPLTISPVPSQSLASTEDVKNEWGKRQILKKKKTKQKKETGRKYYMKEQSTYTGYRAAA